MKHTDGPWTCHPLDRYGHYIIKQKESLSTVTPLDLISTDQALSDARLIAAAPELLEALLKYRDRIVSDIESEGDRTAIDKYSEIDSLDVLIQKATGGAE